MLFLRLLKELVDAKEAKRHGGRAHLKTPNPKWRTDVQVLTMERFANYGKRRISRIQ